MLVVDRRNVCGIIESIKPIHRTQFNTEEQPFLSLHETERDAHFSRAFDFMCCSIALK